MLNMGFMAAGADTYSQLYRANEDARERRDLAKSGPTILEAIGNRIAGAPRWFKGATTLAMLTLLVAAPWGHPPVAGAVEECTFDNNHPPSQLTPPIVGIAALPTYEFADLPVAVYGSNLMTATLTFARADGLPNEMPEETVPVTSTITGNLEGFVLQTTQPYTATDVTEQHPVDLNLRFRFYEAGNNGTCKVQTITPVQLRAAPPAGDGLVIDNDGTPNDDTYSVYPAQGSQVAAALAANPSLVASTLEMKGIHGETLLMQSHVLARKEDPALYHVFVHDPKSATLSAQTVDGDTKVFMGGVPGPMKAVQFFPLIAFDRAFNAQAYAEQYGDK